MDSESPSWKAMLRNALTDGWTQFSDPEWTNHLPGSTASAGSEGPGLYPSRHARGEARLRAVGLWGGPAVLRPTSRSAPLWPSSQRRRHPCPLSDLNLISSGLLAAKCLAKIWKRAATHQTASNRAQNPEKS